MSVKPSMLAAGLASMVYIGMFAVHRGGVISDDAIT